MARSGARGSTRVAPPTWRNNNRGFTDSRQAFKELTSTDDENGRPVFLYMTSSDEEMTQKIQTYEDSVLYNEKVCIAARFFDCYQVDVTDIDKDHPILKLIKKPRALTFYTIHGGKILYGSKEKPSASSLFQICSKTLKKLYHVSLKKIAKEEEKILDELDKVLIEREKIEMTRLKKGSKLSKKEDLAFQKREQELFDKEADLRERERQLLDLRPKEEAETAKS